MNIEAINKAQLAELYPSFADRVRLWMQVLEADSERFDVLITSAGRSEAEQLALWKQGRDANGKVIDEKLRVTNAKTGEQAPHCHGGAVDTCPVIAGKPLWKRLDLYEKMNVAARAVQLVCGVDFGDNGHYEDPGWRNFPLLS